MYSYEYIPAVYKPTRSARYNAILIDNISTNGYKTEHVVSSGILYSAIYDHFSIFLLLKNPRKNSSYDFTVRGK